MKKKKKRRREDYNEQNLQRQSDTKFVVVGKDVNLVKNFEFSFFSALTCSSAYAPCEQGMKADRQGLDSVVESV